MIKLDRILLPTDFSKCSERAVSYASELAKRFTSEVHLLHVVPPISLPGQVGPIPEQFLHREEDAQKELDKWSDPSFEQVENLVRSVITGTPFVEIVRYARNESMDLIVMGTHGHSGLMHVLIGSVAEKVVRKASCPVLTVRPEGHQFVMP